MTRITLLLLLIHLFSAPGVYAQDSRPEKKLADYVRDGKYYEYWDKDSTKINARGHFCAGTPCKTWKYFNSDGTRRMKVKYRDQLKIKYYSASGKLNKKGFAMLDINSQEVHFYWHGRWKYYDKRRKLYRIAIFSYGEEIELLMGPIDPVYVE